MLRIYIFSVFILSILFFGIESAEFIWFQDFQVIFLILSVELEQ